MRVLNRSLMGTLILVAFFGRGVKKRLRQIKVRLIIKGPFQLKMYSIFILKRLQSIHLEPFHETIIFAHFIRFLIILTRISSKIQNIRYLLQT